MALRQLQVELLPGAPVGLAREQVVAKRQPLEGLGLALEGVDEVPVVELAPAPAVGRFRAARQRQHEGSRQVAIQPIPVKTRLEPMADQVGRGAVQNGPHGEGATAGDQRLLFDEVGGASHRQVTQLLALDAARRTPPRYAGCGA